MAEILEEATFPARVAKVGNSYSVRIPMIIVGEMKLEEGTIVEVTIRWPKRVRKEDIV